MAVFFSFLLGFFSPILASSEGQGIILESKSIDIEQDYDQLYMYRSPKRDIEQRLYVKAKGDNKIQFRLIVIKENCDEAFDGEASTNTEQDPEIDEDAEGNAYVALAYLFSTSAFDMSLRIGEDKQKMIVQFEASEKNAVSCVPVSGKLMYIE